MLPFAPWVWPFMLHRFYHGEGPELSLFCHGTCSQQVRRRPPKPRCTLRAAWRANVRALKALFIIPFIIPFIIQ